MKHEKSENTQTDELKNLFVKIPESLHREVKGICGFNGVQVSDFVSSALIRYIRDIDGKKVSPDHIEIIRK